MLPTLFNPGGTATLCDARRLASPCQGASSVTQVSNDLADEVGTKFANFIMDPAARHFEDIHETTCALSACPRATSWIGNNCFCNAAHEALKKVGAQRVGVLHSPRRHRGKNFWLSCRMVSSTCECADSRLRWHRAQPRKRRTSVPENCAGGVLSTRSQITSRSMIAGPLELLRLLRFLR